MEIDDFCGTTLNDGKLTVIGWEGRQGTGKIYKVHCSECANDPELHGDAVFRITKGRLVRGILPCGCSQRTHWSADQYRVLLSRKSAGRYSVIVPDGIKVHDKVQCTCNAEGCGHIWDTSITSLLNIGSGCRKCAGQLPITESEALERVQDICSERGWTFNGFKDGWIGAAKTKLNLNCHCGCEWSPIYTNTIHTKLGCPSCAKTGYDNSKPGTFYTHIWTHPNGHQFLKFGITNKPKQRIKQQKRNTNYTPKQLVSIEFTDGSIAQDIEAKIDDHKKQNNIPHQVTKSDFLDGFSETLPLSEWPFIVNLIQEQTVTRLAPL